MILIYVCIYIEREKERVERGKSARRVKVRIGNIFVSLNFWLTTLIQTSRCHGRVLMWEVSASLREKSCSHEVKFIFYASDVIF